MLRNGIHPVPGSRRADIVSQHCHAVCATSPLVRGLTWLASKKGLVCRRRCKSEPKVCHLALLRSWPQDEMAHIVPQWRQEARQSLQQQTPGAATGIETGRGSGAEVVTSSLGEAASVRCLAARASTSGPLTITAARCARLVVTRNGVTWTGTNIVVDSGVRRRGAREDS